MVLLRFAMEAGRRLPWLCSGWHMEMFCEMIIKIYMMYVYVSSKKPEKDLCDNNKFFWCPIMVK